MGGDTAPPAAQASATGLLLTAAAGGLLLLPHLLRLGGQPADVVAAAVAAVAVAAAVALWRSVRRRPDGFLPRRLVTDPTVLAALGAGAGIYGGLFASLRIVPSALTLQHGWSVAQVGAALLPGAAAGAVLSRLTRRAGHRGGRLLAGAAAAMTAALAAAGILDHPVSLLVAASVCLATVTAAQAVLTTLVSHRHPGHRATAIGVLNLGCFLGGAVGATAADITLSASSGPRLAPAAVAALPMLAALAANRLTNTRTGGSRSTDQPSPPSPSPTDHCPLWTPLDPTGRRPAPPGQGDARLHT